ncbi:MAG: hypothetical protein LQ347_005520 [Umbilicaria vellea]|nr:MAG: hypothetical protein LQ347_005520 [Umbilicaria vellea]
MATSAIWGMTRRSGSTREKTGDGKTAEGARQQERARRVVLRLAIPQLVLAVMTLTTYHVQIITRLSSGYPVWYWWLASMMSQNREMVVFGKKWQLARVITRWMVVYAIVQGGLFSVSECGHISLLDSTSPEVAVALHTACSSREAHKSSQGINTNIPE